MNERSILNSEGGSMQSFYQDVLAHLSRPLLETQPQKHPTLYPEGQPPDLLIFLGNPDPTLALNIRAQLPSRTFLFYLYPPSPKDNIDLLGAALMQGGRNLIAELSSSERIAEKVMLLITMLPERQTRLVIAPGIQQSMAEPVRDIQDAIRAALDNCQQDRNRGLIRLRCSIRNLPGIIRNRGVRLARIGRPVAAIVCGAGPSLPTQLDALRAGRDRFVLIAVGHSVSTLIKAGIKPDLIVEVDAMAYRNWPQELRPDCPFLACSEVAPVVASRFARIVWCEGSSIPFNTAAAAWGLHLLNAQLSKTVTVPAVDAAVRIGATRIALVGQDLCVSSTGELHAGEGLSDEVRRPLEVQGNDVPLVHTTRDLVALREGLQGYLRTITRVFEARGDSLRVFNCTAGGARIENTERLTLQEFLDSAPPMPPATRVIEESGPPPWDSTPLLELTGFLGSHHRLLEQLVAVCGRLRAALTEQDMDMERVRSDQARLQAMVREEIEARGCRQHATWLNPIAQHVDHVMHETPGLTTQAIDPFAQLDFLRRRYQYQADLCGDLRRDCVAAATELGLSPPPASPVALPPTIAPSPFEFRAFLGLALERIAPFNPELADFLLADYEPLDPRQFQVRWMNQFVPYVKVRTPDNNWTPLTGLETMLEEARIDLDAFMSANAFDPERHALVFAGPGNWTHVAECSRRFPGAKMMVVDPWPTLLARMIRHGAFLHLLPPDTLVLGLHARLPGWRALFDRKLAEWKNEGRIALCFRHPLSNRIPELAALSTQLGF